MEKKQQIPSDYKPYDHINFCSNKLSNVNFLFSDNDFVPLLVGSGEIPKIWIYVKYKNDYITIVNSSISKNKNVFVDIDTDLKTIEVKLNNSAPQTLILVNYKNFDDVRIDKVNLTPIGYKVIGDQDKLMIAGNNIRKNFMKGLNTFIQLGAA